MSCQSNSRKSAWTSKRKGILAAALALSICPNNSFAQDISIGTERIQVEVAPGTIAEGSAVDLGARAVAIEFRATGAQLPLEEQCESFDDMREQQVIEGSAALRFAPLQPRPELAYSLRPVTPGWSEKWEAALLSLEIPQNSRFSSASADWRPDVVSATIELNLNVDDPVLLEAIDQLQETVNQTLFQNRPSLQNPGVISIRVESMLAACALLKEDIVFSYRHVLKGPNVVSESIPFDGGLDRAIIAQTENLVSHDNSPSGVVDRDLSLVLLVRLVQSLNASDIEISFDEISVLDAFSSRWAGLLGGTFRILGRQERDELLGSLVEEDVRALFFEHVGSTVIEAKLTEQ